MLKFLAYRQFPYLAHQEDEEDDEDAENLVELDLQALSLNDPCQYVGYNGRWNKKADTCYCWWAGGALKVSAICQGSVKMPCLMDHQLLDQVSMVNLEPSRGYLLDITQHRIGGFSKTVGGPPDIFHSYLGLASLALMGQDSLKSFDVGLCCSEDITRKIALAREGLDQAVQKDSWANDGFWEAVDH